MKLLLDTCTMLWAALEPEHLSSKAKELLVSKESEIYCSTVSTAEIACLYLRKRILLDTHWKKWIREVLKLNSWEMIPINNEIMEEAYCLPEPFHADPADRIIAATSRMEKLTVLTGDRLLLSNPHLETIW